MNTFHQILVNGKHSLNDRCDQMTEGKLSDKITAHQPNDTAPRHLSAVWNCLGLERQHQDSTVRATARH